MKKKTLNALLLVTLATVGCGVDPADDPATLDTSDPDALTLTSTSVLRLPDGTYKRNVVRMSPNQLGAENRLRQSMIDRGLLGPGHAAEFTSQDLSCNATSLWMYDAINRGGNRICFADHSLTQVVEFMDGYGWTSRVRSFWPGDEAGTICDSQTPQPFNCQDFGVWGPLTNANALAQSDDYIIM